MNGEQERLAEVVAAAGPITGRASGDGGAVTVEVGVGGTVRQVRLTPHALRYGAEFLCQTVLATAARATARANQRAHLLYQRALGPRADEVLDAVGLAFDPELVEDEDTEVRVQVPTRPATAHPAARRSGGTEDDEFPDSWMRRG